MKIISKYKDFYDFITQDHDSDLTYVRKIGIVTDYYDNLFSKDGNHIPYFNKYSGYKNIYGYKDAGYLTFDNYIFGIYPFVYSQPVLNIKLKSITGYDEYKEIIISKNIVDNILSSSQNISEQGINDLIKEAQKNIDNAINTKIYKSCTAYFGSKQWRDIQKELKAYVWKVDCPEVFYKIKSPIFTKYYYTLYNTSCYYNEWPTDHPSKDTIHYVTDISFQKLSKNILKYWYDDLFDLNTYINIENFLWSIKQEPIANPDNKTRIIAHGFDLKTSFRKM